MAAPSINENSPITAFTHSDATSDAIRALTYESKWGTQGLGTGATVYFSFPSSDGHSDLGQGYSTEPSNDPNAVFMRPDYPSEVQINAAKLSFQQWANVANLTFIEVPIESTSSVGDIRVSNFTITQSPPDYRAPYAFAYSPSASDSTGISGDIWFNQALPYDSVSEYAAGARGYRVMLHETGHALGLDHPFIDDNDAADKVTLPVSKEHYQYTLMSYNDVAGRSALEAGVNVTYYPTTPMLLDIQAIQYLYGANTSYNTGNNTYSFGQSYAYETIWDADGDDTIENVGVLNSVINLNAGEFSSIGPSVKAHRGIFNTASQENIAIAYGVTIENAKGGSGNDVIYGNEVSNVVDGGEGADTFITQLKRADITSIIQRNNGEILLSSATQQDILTNIEKVNFADDEYFIEALLQQATTQPIFMHEQGENKTPVQANDYQGSVAYLQFEYVGSAQNENLIATDTNDFINLLAGDDAAVGGGGDDVLDGGLGSNFLSGGHGHDVFFLDGRSHQITWSTITDFDGDAVNIWGWVDGISKTMLEEVNGAEGYQGITLHFDLDGNNAIDTSVTFTGLTLQDIANRVAASVESNGYLLITG